MNKVKQPPAVKPEDIATVKHARKRTPIEVSANRLRPAPWNPRQEITPESVADIAASIRELGLIQRIVVIRDPEKKPVRGVEFYMIVAGHRRFAAWKAADIGGKIPCELIDCTVDEAKRMTLIENLQRNDVDPIMEADLIAGLVESGMTEKEIAAETGRGEKWVWRRKQLQKLTPSWKEKIARGCRFTVDCLERISSYSAEVQDEVAETFDDDDDTLTPWNYLGHRFTSRSRELKDANFPKNECTHCPNNSANAPMLFDVETNSRGRPVKWGRCLCAKCFEEKRLAAIEVMKKTAADLGHEIKEVKREGEVPRSWDMTDKPDKDHPVFYVYTDYNGRKQCGYGVKPVESEASEDGTPVTEEDVKAAKKAKRDLKNAQKALSEYFAPTDDPITGITKEARETIDTVVFGITPAENFSRSMSIDQSVLWKILCLSNVFGMDFWDDSASLGEFSDKLLQEDVGIVKVEEYEAWRKSLCERLSEVSTDAYNCDYKMVMKYFGDYVKDDLPPGTLDALDEKDPEKTEGDGSEADDGEILKEAEDF